MKPAKLCAFCHQENDATALHCSSCGASFAENMQTPVVPPQAVNPIIFEAAPEQFGKPVPRTIAFYINGEKQPVLMPANGKIVLGRNLGTQEQTVDLADYYAHLLGVSRQHATISINQDSCVIEDLNSTNGTWLNEQRLSPNQPYNLHNGDFVRLGHLLLIVMFRE